MPKTTPNEKDPKVTAQAAGLHYVHDTEPGILRKKKRKGFIYVLPNGKPVSARDLKRIHSLGIPPAWTDVWICASPNGHLQVTGRDAKGRKQYLYHPLFRKFRDETKYDRMLEFAAGLPKVRRRVDKDLGQKSMSRERVLAAVLKVLEKTLIRVGNEEYVKENHHFGLTTLSNKQVEVEGSTVHFHFKGKSGVWHDVEMSSLRVAKVIKKCQDLPGQELFSFRDEAGSFRSIHSHDVNDYLKELTGKDITAKDFRTWFGSVKALQDFCKLPLARAERARKKNVVAVVGKVAAQLGNTKAVCRKSYIYPGIIETYMQGGPLEVSCKCKKGHPGLHPDEQALVHFLERHLRKTSAALRS
jgi:DNA topoisomerase-1